MGVGGMRWSGMWKVGMLGLELIDVERLSPKLKAIADPARLRIVRLLAELPDEEALEDPRCGSEYGVCFCHLEKRLGLSAPTVSHHLRILRQAGLIEGVRVGRWTYYRLRPGALEQIAGAIGALAASSRRRLARAE